MTQVTQSADSERTGENREETRASGVTTPEAQAPVLIRELSKSFRREGGAIVHALDNINLEVRDHEILVLLGPSGCGKTTLLRCIAGLDEPGKGTIRIGGVEVFNAGVGYSVPPNKRDVNMMFQSYALWPHMTLERNVAFPLRIGGMKRSLALAKANEYLALVGLDGLSKQYAGNISGGQQQRAALARTLVSDPAVVLFDEPLSNVDAKVRAQLRSEILRLHSELKFAAVYVTHDQTEAMALGDRLAVMDHGKVAQIASPVEVYNTPTTTYVAQFIGAANMLEAQFIETLRSSGNGLFRTPLGDIEVEPALGTDFRDIQQDQTLHLMVRPEVCVLTAGRVPAQTPPNTWTAQVTSAVFAGSQTEYSCLVNDVRISVWRTESRPLPEGSEVYVSFPPESVRVIHA